MAEDLFPHFVRANKIYSIVKEIEDVCVCRSFQQYFRSWFGVAFGKLTTLTNDTGRCEFDVGAANAFEDVSRNVPAQSSSGNNIIFRSLCFDGHSGTQHTHLLSEFLAEPKIVSVRLNRCGQTDSVVV